jgi:glycine betaine/proline transport system permease protein
MYILIEFPSLSRETIRGIKTSIDALFRSFSRSYGDSIEKFFDPILFVMNWIERILTTTPWPIVLLALASATFYFTRDKKITVMVIVYLLAVGLVGLWVDTMYTLSLVMIGTALSVTIGMPFGILLAKSNTAVRIATPIMDVMQTIPIFVYLIPVVMILGLGKIPGLISMCIYSVPPIIRLTNLGIRSVDKGSVEAAYSLGMTRYLTLKHIELPLAKKSILAGLNQTIMMSISMVVIASMIGVHGLGTSVLQAVQNQYIGSGLISGSAIVGLAIILDRIVQNAR